MSFDVKQVKLFFMKKKCKYTPEYLIGVEKYFKKMYKCIGEKFLLNI